jgi:crossover junction endodeoxyribonuclease RuvC
MRIIGIDPGLRCTGFGVIDVEGQQARYVGSGVIRPPVQGSEPERLANIFRGVQELVAHFSPH